MLRWLANWWSPSTLFSGRSANISRTLEAVFSRCSPMPSDRRYSKSAGSKPLCEPWRPYINSGCDSVWEGMEREKLESALEALHPASFGWALSCCYRAREEAEEVL